VKFPWIRCNDGLARPLLRVGFRKAGKPVAVDTLLLVDTGADGVLLPFALASLMGFSTSDLESQQSAAVGGAATVWRPRGPLDVEIELGGHWLSLPSLAFAEKTPPLLGRDLIFRNFELRMSATETELRLLQKAK
jgi:hypothetical protein